MHIFLCGCAAHKWTDSQPYKKQKLTSRSYFNPCSSSRGIDPQQDDTLANMN